MSTRILGHTFVPMDDTDRAAFAGAPDGSLICAGDDFVLLYDPETHVVSEFLEASGAFDSAGAVQRDWTPTEL